MRNLNLEAAIWSLITSTQFFEAAARECEETMEWFGALATARKVANFGRNNQIFDKLKQRAHDFRRGAELARLGDYKLIWEVAGCVNGDVRGLMEQRLHSWMTVAEHREFESVRISRLVLYAGLIESALNNAIGGAESFFESGSEEGSDDDGFPGNAIVGWYEESKDRIPIRLPEPPPQYTVNTLTTCQTGDEVPWTGVWYPSTGLENYSLTFAIKGLRMQPAYRVTKTAEEFEAGGEFCATPETVAEAIAWHPLILSTGQAATDEDLQTKAGEPCPKAGIWRPMEPGAVPRAYEVGEAMANLGSAYGITVWSWMADH